VPAEYVRATLKLKEAENGWLAILNAQDEAVAAHRLVFGRNQRVVVAAHYAHVGKGERPVGRPTAVQMPRDAPEVEVRPLSRYDEQTEVAA